MFHVSGNGQAQEAQQQQYQPQLQPPQNSAAHQPMMQQQWGGEQAGPVSLNNYASQQQAPQQAGQEQAAPSKPLGFKFKFGAKATPSVRQSAEAPAQPADVLSCTHARTLYKCQHKWKGS